MADKYYAMIDGEQKGPFSLEELPQAGVRPSTYIWCKGLPDWQKAEDNAEVCRLFRNHLYDIMHPQVPVSEPHESTEGSNNPWKVQPDKPDGPYPSKFDGLLQKAGEEPLPTLEDIDKMQDKTVPPVSMIGYAWVATIICFFPTGIVGLVYAYKSKKEWKKGDNALSHEYSRRAKMWTGVTFFIGIILYGLLLAFSL